MGENQVKKLSLLVESNFKQLQQKSWGKKIRPWTPASSWDYLAAITNWFAKPHLGSEENFIYLVTVILSLY